MTDFATLNVIVTNLVQYFTGSYALLGMLFLAGFFLIIVSRGIDFRYASAFTLPLVGVFVGLGWFGTIGFNDYIINMLLVVISLFYGFAVIKIMT